MWATVFITMTFNEPIVKGTGVLVYSRVGSIAEEIDVTRSQITFIAKDNVITY